MSDKDIIKKILGHISAKTTDMGDEVWREPVESYQSDAVLLRKWSCLSACRWCFARPQRQLFRNPRLATLSSHYLLVILESKG
ncbi:MAG: hypothetical protein O3C28_20590 [Proteobacteria bacterium]|nr:hypothetical protein [Pseudomonadota bacterium]